MDREDVECTQVEEHDVEGEDDAGRVQTLPAGGQCGDPVQQVAHQEDEHGAHVQDVPQVLEVAVRATLQQLHNRRFLSLSNVTRK